ncbi:MAG TPA: GNAT family N-acetyltransferase [Phycisphaerales bacterium]|jgi:predicted GNAT family N-acyltransferase|nr:GNAT family N-acetyltransferase [Phycisphaerales bacterium]HIB01574.1 GNAT family N-acetyltransferase [Phycisphaerales bacterium]HIB51154.1 GNAT family N-acetyltransferase [Phycisphaerales bacterium]HIN83534.1 GNAT family N-acetyltransferase [Phycisphaerales bacterium]HIO52613.1 GNAT family N-acetyltransferase [Phycisphaerales bacterium]
MLIERVIAEDCYALRESILRPGQPKENWTFEADDDPRTIHLAMKDGEDIVAIVSLLPEVKEGCSWRLRGMAVKEQLQGQGIGQQLLVTLVAMVKDDLWCTARKDVHDFYLKNGFEVFGDEFVMNNLEHVLMRRVRS